MQDNLEKPKIKYFTYIRKSTEEEDRQLLSIDAQKYELEKYANKLGLEIVDTFVESKSAYKIGRPEFAEMLSRVDKREANGVLCWQPNRISRNPKDAGDFIYLLSTSKILELRTPYKTFTADSSDQLLLTIELGLAKKDSDGKSEDIRRGNRDKLRKGQLPGMAIQGYINAQNPVSKERYVDKDPDRFILIQQALRLILDSGYTPMEALHTLNDDWNFKTRVVGKLGGNNFSRSSWYKLLNNPFIYGYIDRKDGQAWGNHPPLVTQEDFEKLQIILGNKATSHYSKDKDFPYKKILKCGGCGGSVTAHDKWQVICSECKTKFAKTKNRDSCTHCGTPIEKMHKPTILHYTYLSCAKKTNPNCTQKAIRLKDLENTIETEINKFEIDDEFLELAIKYIHEVSDVDVQINQMTDDSHKLELENLKYSLSELLKLKVSPQNKDGSVLSETEYLEQRKPMLNRIKELENLVNDNKNRAETSKKILKRLLTLLGTLITG